MILIILSLFKTSLGSGIILSDNNIHYLAEIRSFFTEETSNSKVTLSLRSGMLSPEDTFYIQIDRAIVGIERGGFEFTLGRENIFWGYGIFYSPFSYARSSASPFDFELLRSGKNIISLRYNNIEFMTPEFLLFLPSSPHKDSLLAGLRANFFLGNLEIHTPFVFGRDSVFSGLGMRFSLMGFTIYSDYSIKYNQNNTSSCITSGFNKFFGNNIYIQSEYYYNQKGLSSDDYDNLSDTDITGYINPGYTGKHYIYSTIQYIFYRVNTINIYSLIHPEWKSGFAGLALSSSYFKNSTIILNLIKIMKGREFDYIPFENAYTLELRYYF